MTAEPAIRRRASGQTVGATLRLQPARETRT